MRNTPFSHGIGKKKKKKPGNSTRKYESRDITTTTEQWTMLINIAVVLFSVSKMVYKFHGDRKI